MCDIITSTNNTTDPIMLLSGINKAVQIFLNYTGRKECFDVDFVQTGDVNQIAWGYQVFKFFDCLDFTPLEF
jgi:hypothetical protein